MAYKNNHLHLNNKGFLKENVKLKKNEFTQKHLFQQ